MQTCAKCSHRSRDGVLLCENCGQPLNDQIMPATHKVDTNATDWSADFVDGSLVDNTAQMNKISLHIQNVMEPIVVDMRAQIVLGRVGVHTVRRPDVDLTTYSAFRRGVSSLHATI